MLDQKIKNDELIDQMYSTSNSVSRVELFDEYKSDKLGKNKKSIAFHIYMQEMDRTMTDEEANKIVKKIIKIVENTYQAKLRD